MIYNIISCLSSCLWYSIISELHNYVLLTNIVLHLWTISFFFTVETFVSFCINYCRTMEYNYDSNDSNFCSSKLKRASWSESDLWWLFLFLNGIINPWIFWSHTKFEAKLLEVYWLLFYLWGCLGPLTTLSPPPHLSLADSIIIYIDDSNCIEWE